MKRARIPEEEEDEEEEEEEECAHTQLTHLDVIQRQ